MKDIILNYTMNKIKINTSYDNTKLLEIRYGLETFYLNVTKMFIILLLNIIFKTFKEFVLFVCAFSLLRTVGFGLHAKKSWQCWISSIPIFILIPYLIKNVIISKTIYFIITPILVILILIYAPADTEKRPLIRKKRRLLYKLLSLFFAIVYLTLIFCLSNNYISCVLFYSLLLEVIIINPITYKLFGLKYKNYLNYERRKK